MSGMVNIGRLLISERLLATINVDYGLMTERQCLCVCVCDCFVNTLAWHS